jgi:hypothetical protein
VIGVDLLLVWVELVPPPFWLDPATVVDIVAGWCSWSSGMSLKVGCSDPFDDGGQGLIGWLVERELVLIGGLG